MTALGSHISLKQLAAEIGMDRSAARRYILRLGIAPVKRRTGDSGFQIALTVTKSQGQAIKLARASDGYLLNNLGVTEQCDDLIGRTGLSAIPDNELIAELLRRLTKIAKP